MGNGRRRPGNVFGGASSDSSAELRAKVVQKSLCHIFVVFSGAMKGLHSRYYEFLISSSLFGPRNRSLSQDNIAKGAVWGCEGTFRLLEESENLIIDLGEAAVEATQLSTEQACAKRLETVAELSVIGILMQCGRCEVRQRQRDPLGLQLPTDASKSLTALLERSKANGDGGSTGYLMIFYVPGSAYAAKYL